VVKNNQPFETIAPSIQPVNKPHKLTFQCLEVIPERSEDKEQKGVEKSFYPKSLQNPRIPHSGRSPGGSPGWDSKGTSPFRHQRYKIFLKKRVH
jgi:hypothetical protein